ncbi:MAG TPA: RNA 2',3'-cyclic phosphodiesterase [Burkholderiales bacterium]
MRLFFALWPPAKTAHALAQWTHQVARDTGGTPTPSDKIHLTLAFLGEADPGKAFNAAQRAQGARHALPIGHAYYWKHNKIVWVGPQGMPAPLAALVSQLHAALKEHGFVLEDRPFAAHITLLRKAKPPKALPPLPTLEWPVSEFLLVRSRTSPKGSTYEPIERFPLL